MASRETKSLVGSFVVSLGLLVLIVWLLSLLTQGEVGEAAPAKGAESSAPAAVPETEVQVALAPDSSMATASEGSDAVASAKPDEQTDPTPPETMPVEAPVEETADQNQPQQTPSQTNAPTTLDAAAQTNAVAASSVPASSPPKPSPPAAKPESDAGQGEETQLTLAGQMPPFRYLGATRELYQEYPPLSMCWVLDRDPGQSQSQPGVYLEIVFAGGRIYWRNERTGDASPGFGLATLRHNLNERTHVSDPGKLGIWPRRDEVLRLAGLTDPRSPRLKWGYHRHRAEVAMLNRVKAAFVRGVETKAIEFQPERRDSIEVEWGQDAAGKPCVKSARFKPQTGDAVALELPTAGAK